jgi:phosphoribosylanthranilate isomerase
MTRVKICGIRTLEDAQVAAGTGADFIGLVFVPGRRRRLETEAAREIVDGLKGSSETAPKIVGLFADQPLDEVNRIIGACNLDLAQLCGAELLDYCQNTNAQVIKVLHIPHDQPSAVSGQELGERVLLHREAGHMVTLDRLVEGLQGGTGESFDWSIAAELSQQGHSFLMAGGLSPDNVTDAVAMAHPWGVDVSSGVETDGVKDHQKIRDFIQNARRPST